MNPEAQRVAIAQWCGWKLCGTHSPVLPGDDGIMRKSPTENTAVTLSLLPDYLNDLNAMHEAEKRLSKQEQLDYCYGQLVEVCGDRLAYMPTAAQRAEALLKTIGRWKDD